VAPQRILMGGGVLSAQPHLYARIRARLAASLNHYLELPEWGAALERCIVPPGLGANAGPLGALAVAVDAAAAVA